MESASYMYIFVLYSFVFILVKVMNKTGSRTDSARPSFSIFFLEREPLIIFFLVQLFSHFVTCLSSGPYFTKLVVRISFSAVLVLQVKILDSYFIFQRSILIAAELFSSIRFFFFFAFLILNTGIILSHFIVWYLYFLWVHTYVMALRGIWTIFQLLKK